MSLLEYNSVKLPYPMTTSFDQQAVYDDSTTDYAYTKFDIRVQCLINWNYLDQLAPALLTNTNNPDTALTTSPADIMKYVRDLLLTPRKALSFKFNGVELIPNKQADNTGTCDSANGPLPQSCAITQLTNTTYIVTYHIIAHYRELTPIRIGTDSVTQQNVQGTNVIYNRWEETLSLDETSFAKRTRKGKMKIRSDNTKGQPAYKFIPQMCIVSVPGRSWIRKESYYKIDPSGLIIEYGVTDLQVYKMPPVPAYKAEGTYYERSSSGLGSAMGFSKGDTSIPFTMSANRFVGVDLTLWGSPEVSQSDLLQVALSVALSKIGHTLTIPVAGVVDATKNATTGGDTQGVSNIISEYSFDVDMYNNKVHVSMNAYAGTTRTTRTDELVINPLACFTPGSDSGYLDSENIANPKTGMIGSIADKLGITQPITKPQVPYPPNYKKYVEGWSSLLQAANYWDPKKLDLAVKPTQPEVIPDPALAGKVITVSQLTFGDEPGTKGKS